MTLGNLHSDAKLLRDKAHDILFNCYQPKLSEILLTKVLEIEPHDFYALNDKGYSLYLQDKFYLSIEYYDKALAENPDYSWSLWGKGLSLIKLGKSEEALPLVYKSLEIVKQEDALTTLGYGLSEQKKRHDALTYFQESLALNNEDGYTYQKLGKVLNDVGNYSEAIESYRNAIKYESQSFNRSVDLAESYLGLGTAMYHHGMEIQEKNYTLSNQMFQEADKNYNMVVSLLRENQPTAYSTVKKLESDASVGAGLIQIQLAQQNKENSSLHYKKALENFTIALEIDKQNSDALIYEANTQYELGQSEDSVMFLYNSVLESDPQNVNALINKAKVLIDQNKKRQALSVYERALDLEPNNFEGLFGTAQILSELDDCKSIDYYQRALEANPDDKNVNQLYKNEELKCQNVLGNYIEISTLVESTLAVAASIFGVVIYLKKRKSKKRSRERSNTKDQIQSRW